MNLPTPAEEYAKLIEYIRLSQECAARLAHLEAQNTPLKAQQWLAVSELFKRLGHQITSIATSKVN